MLRPLRDFGTPLQDQVGPLPYTALQSIVENFNPPGLRNYWKTSYLNDLTDEAIDAMVDRYASVPNPHTHVVLYTLGGAVARVGHDTTAVAYRDARHVALVVGMWNEAADDDGGIRWVREFWRALQPLSSDGFYVNYDAEADADQVHAAYGEEKYRRLAELKRKYDPANLFRLNQNIRPSPDHGKTVKATTATQGPALSPGPGP